MTKKIIISLVFTILFANLSFAQTLQSKKIELPGEGGPGSVQFSYTMSADDNNYYVFGSERKGHYVYVVNKGLTKATRKVFPAEKGTDLLNAYFTPDHIILLLYRYNKKASKMEILKKTYSKSGFALRDQKVIASFTTIAEDPLFYSSISPDKTKTGMLFMVAAQKQKKTYEYNQFYAVAFDENLEQIWETTEDLTLSNKVFYLKEIAVTNNAELYVNFLSMPPDERKPANKNSYFDLFKITNGEAEQLSLQTVGGEKLVDVKMKALRNGNLMISQLKYRSKKDDYPTDISTILIDGAKFEANDEDVKEIIPMDKKSKVTMIYFGAMPTRLSYALYIKSMVELDNGDVAIIAEQTYAVNVEGQRIYYKGDVLMAFVDKEGAIQSMSILKKFQKVSGNALDAFISVHPFVYGNQLGLLYNESLKNVQGKGGDNLFEASLLKKGNRTMVCYMQAPGENPTITCLTGNKEADALLKQIYVDKNRVVLLTRNTKKVYIEVVEMQ